MRTAIHPTTRSPRLRTSGFTLVELMVGAGVLVVAVVALLSTFATQLTVTANTQNLDEAMNDATRVMEALRRQNSNAACAAPSATAPVGFATWDAWLANTGVTGGGGKSIQPTPNTNELVVVTAAGADPLTVTVAVCWRGRNRTIGECTWNGAALARNPGAGGDLAVTESPAMLSTVLTCRTP